MQKIIIIGPGGAGKSTLSKRLAKKLRIPVIHLDTLYWKEGWVETPLSEWEKIQTELVSHPQWILDGNYEESLDIRLQSCDTVIFLDFPRYLTLYRVIKRYLTYRRKQREDRCKGCQEKLSYFFLKWVWDYPTKSRPFILKKLSLLQKQKKVNIHILSSQTDIDTFLETLKD